MSHLDSALIRNSSKQDSFTCGYIEVQVPVIGQLHIPGVHIGHLRITAANRCYYGRLAKQVRSPAISSTTKARLGVFRQGCKSVVNTMQRHSLVSIIAAKVSLLF